MINVIYGVVATFLSVDSIFFWILDYPMSYIEFFGTIFYLASVWLIAKGNMWNWSIGIISVILYFFLFYQIQLYSDALEQLYYLGASVYGWIYWKKTQTKKTQTSDSQKPKEKIGVILSEQKIILFWVGLTLVISILLTLFITRLHVWAPVVFPEPASFPFLDAVTTIMSFTAMYLMAQKRLESWVYWLIVDIVGIVLYYVKDVKFLSLLYVILLIVASNGFREWRLEYKESELSK